MNRNSKSVAQQAVRQARHDAYRELILQAAERIFGERGYGEAKVAEIALAAGVATGTVYGIFPSKRDLYRAVHRENLGELARLYAEMPEPESAGEGLLDRSRVSTLFLTARPHYLRMYLREAQHWGFDPEQLPADATAFVDHDLYRRGIESGEFIDDDPQLIQSLLLSSSQVHLEHWLRTGMEETPEALATRIQAFARRALFRAP